MFQKLVDPGVEYVVCTPTTWQDKLIARLQRELRKKKRARFLVTIENGKLEIEQIGKVETLTK